MAKTKAAADQAVTVQTELPTINPAASNDADFKGPMLFDLDPKQVTSIINGNHIVVFRGGIESVLVNAKIEGSD